MRLSARNTQPSSKRGAFALVEVVAALVLLSTVACSLLLAHSRSVHNLADHDVREQASTMARELILAWRIEEIDVTLPANGTFGDSPSWSWNRNAIAPMTESGEWVRIRLDVLYRDGVLARRTVGSFEWLEVGFENDER